MKSFWVFAGGDLRVLLELSQPFFFEQDALWEGPLSIRGTENLPTEKFALGCFVKPLRK
jgi:hypothetical protein